MNLFVISIICVGSYFIYKFVYRGLRKLDVEEKIAEIKLVEEVKELVDENKEAKKSLNKNEKDINKFLN